MKGDDRPQQVQQTTYQPPAEVGELLRLGLPGVREFAAQVPQRYRGETIAGFDPLQLSGQQQLLEAAGRAPGAAGAVTDIAGRLGAGNYTPETRTLDFAPRLNQAITAATRPITDELLTAALPAIRSEAIQTGNFGGSRQGIAEGQAIGRASQAVGDTAAKLSNAAYATDVDAALRNYQLNLGAGENAARINAENLYRAAGLYPQATELGFVPGAITSGVGDIRQAQAQQRINQDIAGYNYDQLAPFLQSKEILSLVSGIPGGTNVSTANNPPQAPDWQRALGGAASGAALGTAILPGIGTGVGAAGGALLPFLFS